MKKYLLSLSIALATIGIANAQYSSSLSGLELKTELAYAGMITAEDYVRNHATTFDADGNASVLFYNNGKSTNITISAEGLSADGYPQTGMSRPEER